ncbi:MAG TPA: YitT family protein [Candidatus Ozemobacteraceae bacterium]|nr:YitT family protein [Candidatus Ozemobacteraceae bacterium]
MSLISIVSHILSKKPAAATEHTCPNCGQKQTSAPGATFVCTHCRYQVAHVIPLSQGMFRVSRGVLYELFFILAGPLMAIVGLKGFLIPNGLIDGGVTGISMLLSHLTGIELGMFIFLINIPFIVTAYFNFDKGFAWRASFSIILLSILLPLIKMPVVTTDRLLDSIFGGFFLGTGIAFSIRGGGVLDGTEIMALIISRRFPATVGDSILFFNIIIFSTALTLLSPEHVFYSIITYLSASKTLDFMMHGIESYNGVMIMSGKSQQLRFNIVNNLGRGVTIIKSRGGYSEKDQEVLLCVVTRLEISNLRKLIDEIDENAFVLVFPISDVRGGLVKKVLYEKSLGTH